MVKTVNGSAAVLRKISDEVTLSKEDKKCLDDLIKVFKKARKGKKLDESEKEFIKQLQTMKKSGVASAVDFIRTGNVLLHLYHLFKDIDIPI